MTMKRVQIYILAAAFIICTISAARQSEAAVNVHEGEWETTMDMKMEGMPYAIPQVKQRQCFTKDDLIPIQKEENKNCKIKSQQVVGNKVTWTVECVERGSTYESQGAITFSGDGYKGNITIKSKDESGKTMVSTGVLSGHRIGECTDKDKRTVTVGGREVQQMDPALLEQARKAQAEAERSQSENKIRSAEFSRLAVPVEDPGACVLADKAFADSVECSRKVGQLNMNPGEWEITLVQATKTVGDYMVGNPEKRTECLTFDSMVPSIARGGVDVSEKKRTSGKITWKYRQTTYGSTVDERGGITYKGISLEGVVIKTQTVQPDSVIEYKTKISGSRIGDGNCLKQKRAYTSQKRDYTSQKRNAIPSTKDLGTDTVNKLKGLFGK